MRVENSIKSIASGLAGQLLYTILKVISRVAFVYALGSAYLGLNGLFTGIISILNITELGLSNAIVFALYKPIAEKDYSKISALMNLYKKAYTIIGWIIFTAGVALIPFLPFIVNLGDKQEIVNINVVYMLFLLETTTSYWFFEHKKSFLFAAQKNYIVNGYEYLFKIIFTILQIGSIVFITVISKEYRFYFYSVLGIVGNLCSKFAIKRYANKHYPYQKEYHNEKLTDEDKKAIVKNVSALSLYKICTKISNSITSILISTMLYGGTILVGIYSNYTMITSVIDTCLLTVTKGINASIGDYYVAESKEKSEFLYRSISLLFTWIYGFSSVCLLFLTNNFLFLVFGNEYVLSKSTLLIIVLNFWVIGQTRAANSFRNASGIYWQGKFRPLVNVVINIVAAVLLAKPFGINGILFGILLGNVVTLLWYEPWLVYTKAFQMSWKPCFIKMIHQNVVIMLTCLVCGVLISLLPLNGWINLIVRLLICTIVTNGILLLSNFRTAEFDYIKQKAIAVLIGLLDKKRRL